MLPNHQPLVVAEQFGVLESLFPGRIDMGLGRSVGFTDGIRRALGRDKEDAEDFAAQLDELLGWFRGTSADRQVHARPAEGLTVPPYVLAIGEGADDRRPGRAAAGHRRPPEPGQDAGAASTATARTFRPSAWAERAVRRRLGHGRGRRAPRRRPAGC